MLDLDAIRKRAAVRVSIASPANAANLLTQPISNVAGLAAQRPLMTREDADRCHAGGWTDAEIQTFTGRVLLLVRRGVSTTVADDLAERLTLRDRDGDDRRLCLECRHFRPGRCGNHRAAGLHSSELGRDVAAMLQRCQGYGTEADAQ
jgi:hypothetical protein